jgi:hypothetical protein
MEPSEGADMEPPRESLSSQRFSWFWDDQVLKL